MSWENFKKQAEEAGSGGIFIRLKDGQDVTGVFVGNPHTYYSKFKERTEYPKKVEGSSFRFRYNFVVRDHEGQLKVMILQGGATLANKIIAAKEEEGLETWYKIKRTGSTKDDTEYHLFAKGKLSSDELRAIKELKLHSLVPRERTVIGEANLEEIDYPDDKLPF